MLTDLSAGLARVRRAHGVGGAIEAAAESDESATAALSKLAFDEGLFARRHAVDAAARVVRRALPSGAETEPAQSCRDRMVRPPEKAPTITT